MRKNDFHYTRRDFLATAAIAAGAAALPFAPARAAAKYTRYNVTSPEGQKMLASYAKGVEAMLKLPADNPQNWFRNAFIHLMDCPHGNWWFYVWHRGYLGNFERTIRALSGDDTFALPYWDWTELPQIPDSMFNGALTPTDKAFQPYTGNLALFTSFMQPALASYWKTLSSAQQDQQNLRGYTAFENLWNDVTGFNPNVLPPDGAGISGNEAFATTCASRYLSPDNPKLDQTTTYDVSPFVVYSGLLPTDFNNPVGYLSFTSSKTTSHNAAPGTFSTLEGMPHNLVHNCIGGVGPLDPGPYGNMTNFLSPVDPIFFLHHANMDRLWDVWTRKQKNLRLPYLPDKQDLKTLSDEPFLFYVDGKGNYITNGKAGDYLSTDVFEYDYAPGFGEKVVEPPPATVSARKAAPLARGTVKANGASVVLSNAIIQSHLDDALPRPLMAQVTLPHPGATSSARSFDVLVNAPPGAQGGADSPFYAGTIGFFGAMTGMKMSHDATFVVPLPKQLQAFTTLGAPNAAPGAPKNAKLAATNTTTLNIRLVPTRGQSGPAPKIKAVSVGAS
jgi:tyrosinase